MGAGNEALSLLLPANGRGKNKSVFLRGRVVILASTDNGVARGLVERQGRPVGRTDFEEYALCSDCTQPAMNLVHQPLPDALTPVLRVNRQILQFCFIEHTPRRRKTQYLPCCICSNQQHPAWIFSQPRVVRFLPVGRLRIFLLYGDNGGDIFGPSRSNYHFAMTTDKEPRTTDYGRRYSCHFISASVRRM
jgi:hypothetical protein